jgi:hypothetical protein
VIFTKRLRPGVRNGSIQCSIRIWRSARVKAGRRYRMEDGQIEIDSINEIGLADITPSLARSSGFSSVVDLLKVAKHGSGEKVYFVRFHYIPPTRNKAEPRKAKQGVRKKLS